MAGYVTTRAVTEGYIVAGHITAGYITAGYITTITAGWKGERPYLNTFETNITFDYRDRQLSARSTTSISLT